MTNPVKPLSDDEVAEIEARPWVYPYLHNTEQRVLLRVAERDALCATVRALRADYTLVENYLAGIKRELGLPPNTVLGVTLENYKERVTAPLREQLAENARRHFDDARELERQRDELKDQLAQVTQRARHIETCKDCQACWEGSQP